MIYTLLNRSKLNILPKASEVLLCYLKQTNYPHWTSYFVKYKSVVNDDFAKSYYLFDAGNSNKYIILRTGCFPYIKYHCSKISSNPVPYNTDLKLENMFFGALKVLNLGLPTLAYGLAAIKLVNHKEIVHTSRGNVEIYFWYTEDKNSKH